MPWIQPSHLSEATNTAGIQAMDVIQENKIFWDRWRASKVCVAYWQNYSFLLNLQFLAEPQCDNEG